MNTMTKVLLVRHASTNAVGKTLAGRMDGVSLNVEGIAQARQLANRLQSLPLSALYTSPLQRALETAEPIARQFGMEAKIDDHFVELDFGEWTGRSITSLENDQRFKEFNNFRSNTCIPGGETMLAAQARMVAGLQMIHR